MDTLVGLTTTASDKVEKWCADESMVRATVDFMFQKYDTDGSGFIEKKEFKDVLQEVMENSGAPLCDEEEMTDCFNMISTDGKVSKDQLRQCLPEFMKAMIPMMSVLATFEEKYDLSSADIRCQFDEQWEDADADQSGYLDKKEVLRCMHEIYDQVSRDFPELCDSRPDVDAINDLFDQFDDNENGKLSKREFFNCFITLMYGVLSALAEQAEKTAVPEKKTAEQEKKTAEQEQKTEQEKKTAEQEKKTAEQEKKTAEQEKKTEAKTGQEQIDKNAKLVYWGVLNIFNMFPVMLACVGARVKGGKDVRLMTPEDAAYYHKVSKPQNPLPVLVHGNKSITESAAIGRYLSEMFGLDAKHLSEMFELDAKECRDGELSICKVANQIKDQLASIKNSGDAKTGYANFITAELMKRLEGFTNYGSYCCGNSWSMSDVAIYAQLWPLYKLDQAKLSDAMGDAGMLEQWYNNMASHPGIRDARQKVDSFAQADFPPDMEYVMVITTRD